MYKNHSDNELVKLLQQGERGAFNEIFDRYWDRAYQAAYNILKREDICLDAVQDIFVWLWENREQQRINVLKSYILSAVKFKLLNVIRNAKLRDEVHTRLLELDNVSPSEDENIEVKELQEIIHNFHEQLPMQARQIFYLSRYEFLTNKEIALKLNIAEKTVKNQLNISLKKLRRHLNSDRWFVFFM